jgi:hypothetical protein
MGGRIPAAFSGCYRWSSLSVTTFPQNAPEPLVYFDDHALVGDSLGRAGHPAGSALQVRA